MLGGMWGANLQTTKPNRWEIAESATKLFRHYNSSGHFYKGLDQDLLATFMWPLAAINVVRKNKSL